MCRKNCLWGFCACCLGAGLLLGRCMESGFLSLCLGIGLLFLGCVCFRQK